MHLEIYSNTQPVCPMAGAFPGKEKCIALFPIDRELSLSIHLNKKLHIIKHKIYLLITPVKSPLRGSLSHILYFILYSFGNWLTPWRKRKFVLAFLPFPKKWKKKKKSSREKRKTFPSNCSETEKIIQINFLFCLFVQFKMIKFTSHFKPLQGHFASSESSSTWTILCLSNV